jgi:spectinomycin phosphotransferase
MINKFPIEDSVLLAKLKESYGVEVEHLDFIPVGDSAYSYRVNCENKQKLYLKLFDHQNERQMSGVSRLSYYLPLMWQLYHGGYLKNITYPIKNVRGAYQTTFDGVTIVLFNFIEGETLADAHPFSDDILRKVTGLMVSIQRASSKVDLSSLPKDNFDISFAGSLKECVKELEKPHATNSSALVILRELVLTNKELIKTSLDYVVELRGLVNRDTNELVLCHGDVWGGNIIRNEDELFLIDWESVILAPHEYNVFSYIGDRFDVFYTAYEQELNRQVNMNLDLLRFYSYRAHLRNLTNWIINILCGNNSAAQNNNDIAMIRDHCLNRIAPIEPNIHHVEAILKNRSTLY